MLHTISSIKGYSLAAQKGHIGKIKDVYLDDRTWKIRYLVIHTGSWLSGRDAVLTPEAIGHIDDGLQSVEVRLTKEKIEGAPDIGTVSTVSRQKEQEFYSYYNLPSRWSGWGLAGAAPRNIVPGLGATGSVHTHPPAVPEAEIRLRSANEVIGYHIQATDGEIGHVEDFVLDDASWELRYLVVDTRNWWPGEKVVLPPRVIELVSWENRHVYLRVTRTQVQNAPAFEETFRFKRDLGEVDEYYSSHSP